MKSKKVFFSLFLFLLISFFSYFVLAQDIPIGLQRIIEANQNLTASFSLKISFFIAFVAGILGILSPCILPLLPAYFSYTFKEKINITKMTLIFFLGFSLVFVIMGVIAGFLGEQTFSLVQADWLVTIAGLFLIGMGLLSLSGKGFSSLIKPQVKVKNDVLGIFLFGVFFAIGWTACLGPILAGILAIGAILNNITLAALLLFVYSLGNLLPFFLLSMFYDKLKLSENKYIKGKMLKFSIFKNKFEVHSTNMVSGVLFLLIGIVLVIFKGTAKINKYDIFGTKDYFYSFQNEFLAWDYANIVGIVLFFAFILLLSFFLWNRSKKKRFNLKQGRLK